LAANSAEEALSMANDEERVDLLLTDVIMPGMNGRELSQALRGMRPELRVIYVSGYTDDAVLRSGIHAQRDGFLQKPFALSHLAREVRDILDWSEPKHVDETKVTFH
jgi:YesN/AraC family two-component response regulator